MIISRATIVRALALPLAAVPLAGLALFAPISEPALAQNVASFVVSDDDGYGVDSCLSGGESCSGAVASAWCVANGYQRSMSVRPVQATDVTGSIDAPTQVAISDQAHGMVITCER